MSKEEQEGEKTELDALGEQLEGLEVEEDPDMELNEEDMQVIEFVLDDKPPSDDEDEEGDEELEVEEGYENGEEGEEMESREIEPDNAFTEFAEHSDSVYCIGLSPDGSLGISGGGDDLAYLWNSQTGKVVAKLEGHSDSISDCGFSADGSLIATAGYDSTVRIWSGKDGSFQRSMDGPSSELEWLTWHPKGNVVMAGSEDATCWVWDASNGNCLAVLAGHEAPLTCGQFTANGKRVVTGSLDGSVRLWDPSTSSCVHTFVGHEWFHAGVVSVKCHYEQPMIAAGGQDGTVRIARLETKKILAAFNHDLDKKGGTGALLGAGGVGAGMQLAENDEPTSVETVDFCQSAPFLASGGTDGTVKVFDLNTQTCRQVCKHEDTIVKVQFVPQSVLMVTGSSDGSSRLWDSRSGEAVRLLTNHRDAILDLAFQNGVVATCSDDKTCRVAKLE